MTGRNHDASDPVATDIGTQQPPGHDKPGVDHVEQKVPTDPQEHIQALEARLRAAEARAAQADMILESMTDGVMIFDQTGRVLRMNAAARRVFTRTDGWNEADSLGERPMREPVFDEHGRRLAREELPFARILQGDELAGASAVDVIYRPSLGHPLQVNISGVPLRDERGRIVAALCILRDVTERRRLERRTAEALDALLAMAEAIVQAPEESEISLSPAVAGSELMDATALRLAELTRSVLGCERLGIVTVDLPSGRQTPVAVVGIPEDRIPQWWAQTSQAPFAEIPGFPYIARLQAGEAVVIDMARPPFSEPPFSEMPNPYNVRTALIAPLRVGDHLIGILSYDYGPVEHAYPPQEIALAGAVAKLAALVLERKRLLQERAAAQADALALREANRRMDEFVGIVSHELRTPLTTVVANTQIAQRWVPRLYDGLRPAGSPADSEGSGEVAAPSGATSAQNTLMQLERLLERSDRQAARLTRIVGDLLDMSRIQAGRLELLPQRCDLIAITQEVVDEQRAAHPKRALTLTLPAGATDLPIMADPDRVGQVVTNFLTNALKYAPPELPVEVRVERKGQQARVSVRDQGPGLTKSEQERIWERFQRIERITVASGSGVGLGLGLYISRTIIERLGGQLGVQSARGKGATFWFTLPLAE